MPKTPFFTQQELDCFYQWCDKEEFVCGDWAPTMDELITQIEPLYYKFQADEKKSHHSTSFRVRRKRIDLLLFLLWIGETSETVKTDVYNRIQKFVGPKLKAVLEENESCII